MPLHIPSKTDLKSKLDNLQSQAKKKYIDLSSKLLVFSINSVKHFARHIIVLQGKNPDYVPPEPVTKQELTRVISDIRPSFNFGGSSRGWTQDYFKNPGKYHPILVNRIKMDENGVLKPSKESANASVLQRTLVKPAPLSDALFKELVDEEESFLRTLNDFTSKTVEKENELAKVDIVSGSRAVSKEKKARSAAKKKVQSSPKKTTKVKKVVRVKKGVIHRVED